MRKLTEAEIKRERAIARALFKHDHPSDETDEIVIENCGACALEGRATYIGNDGVEEPNYAGWHLVYVRAHRAIPERFQKAFRNLREGTGQWPDRNPAYRDHFLTWLAITPCPNRHWHHIDQDCAVCGLKECAS